MAEKKDFFISYNKADKAWAEWIAWRLEAAGYTTIIQAWDFKPGGNFVLDMHEAASHTARTIGVLSPDYLTSIFTPPEWAAAFAQDPQGKERIFVPVRVRPCDPSGLLTAISYIDLVGLTEDAAREELLNGLDSTRAKPVTQPAFPGATAKMFAAAPLAKRAKPKSAPSFPTTIAGQSASPSPNSNQQPNIRNVPHQRNPRFTGRKELLANVKKVLSRKGEALKIAALYGLGGVGKTQIALRHVYERQKDYSLVWWLRAEEPATLALDYAKLGEELRLPFDSTSPELVSAVKRWLDTNQGWLLVFDNAVEPKDLKDYLPQENGGVIITTRNPNWLVLAEPMKVQELPPEDAADFLITRTGDKDRQAALDLAKELGCLPLALEQAGAYIEACGSTCARYLELFRVRHKELLKKGQPADYPATVATTWKLSFDSLRKECPAAAELMELCAFLAPEAIPFDLFTEHPEQLLQLLKKAVKDPLKWDEAIGGLKRYSLAEVGQDSLSFHRLVQLVVRNEMKPAARKRQAAAAVALMNEAYPFDRDDLQAWPRAAQLLPHGLAAAEQSQIEVTDDEATAHLLNEMGLHLHMLGQFSEAKALHERALPIAEKVYGPDHPVVSIALNNLGLVLKILGDLEGAKAKFEKGLKISEKVYGPDHPTVAIRLNNLGLLLKDLALSKGAKANIERALQIDEKVYGPDHPTIATDLNNLGSVLHDLGDWKGAKASYERALSIHEKVYGPDHPAVAIDLNNLGLVLHDLGDLQGAKANFDRALEINEKVYGPDHPEVARDLNNLGSVLEDLGELEGAEVNIEKALRIAEKVYGLGHPSVAINLSNLGSVLKALGDLQGAKASHERALSIDEKVYGPDHPACAADLNNLGTVLGALGDLQGAKGNLERALEIDEKVFGPEHPTVAAVLNNLGSVLQDLGDLKGAKADFERARRIHEKACGPDHPEVARDLNNLGSVLLDLGDVHGAKACSERALAIFRDRLGEDHPKTKLVLKNLKSLESGK